ncbi:MAG: hypothetical protein JJ992_16460 [Planctomycetes bacterium]|nr:hypothetical protein [Planctomycetota bacterium]
MNNPLVYQAIGVLLVLFYIFLLVMCWKTWRFTHVFFSFLVFGAAVTFLIFASFVLKTQAAWRTHFEQYTVELAKVKAENERYLNGDPEDIRQEGDSIRALRAALERADVDRGRVWRECRPVQQVGPGTYRISTVPISLPQNETPEPNGIDAQTVLYAFTEQETSDGWRVPAVYLGEFTVTEATDTEVTLAAQLPMSPDQQQAAAQGNTTWALYDMLPLDSHEAFAEYDETEKRLVGMDTEQLRQYLPNRYGLPEDQYQALLERFHRFNRESTEEDSPENIWVLVEFEKAHEIQVDSDVEQSLLADGGRFFDSSGRALEMRLRRGEGEDGTVKFKQGDTAVFDKETADTLIADGVVKQIKTLYRRPLHDFAFFFRDAYFRNLALDQAIQRAQRDAAITAALKAKAEEQLAFRQQEKANLEKDLAGFQREQQEVTAYLQALELQMAQTRQRLSDLFRANTQMVDELTRGQLEMARQINQRVQQATAAEATSAAPRP